MWNIAAPFPLFETIIFLPSADLSNTMKIESRVQHHQMMNGDYVTHKQENANARTYQWSFNLTRRKALELKEFFRLYVGELWQVTDHNDIVLIGYLRNGPLLLEMVSRGVIADSTESVPVTLEFESV